MRLLVTGGAGFIGSAVIRAAIRDTDWTIINVDRLSYAASLDRLAAAAATNKYLLIPESHPAMRRR